MKEMLTMSHATLGAIGIMAALWVIVETINASSFNERRIRIAALFSTLMIILSWIGGGFLYVLYYAADKAIILKGPWPFAHKFFMESKEHLFFATLILAILLPIATRVPNLSTSRGTRIIVVIIATLLVLSAFAIEGAGATVALGVKMGLLANVTK